MIDDINQQIKFLNNQIMCKLSEKVNLAASIRLETNSAYKSQLLRQIHVLDVEVRNLEHSLDILIAQNQKLTADQDNDTNIVRCSLM